jgi:hypothetical protein
VGRSTLETRAVATGDEINQIAGRGGKQLGDKLIEITQVTRPGELVKLNWEGMIVRNLTSQRFILAVHEESVDYV